MQQATEQALFDGMAAETARDTPPPGFPALPMIPGARYTDPAFLALEERFLWKRSWLYALHADELPRPGSYRLWRRTGSPIIIVRGRDDRIRAFYNTCRHRGAPLVADGQGETRGFFCRYHGWTYTLEGKLTAVREKRDFPGMDTSCLGLSEVRCEQLGHWVFINEDPEAPPLTEALAPIPEHLAEMQLERIRHVHSASFEVACNVKILLDAFLETYHLKSIHPQTVDRFLESRGTFHLLWDNGNSLMVTPHRREDWEDPGAVGMPAIDTAPRIFAEQNASYNLYPNLITPISATGIPFLTFWPKGPRDMIVDVHWFAPEGAHGHELWPTRISNFVRILEEDTQFAPQIQESVESGGFRGMVLSYQERRIYHWHEALDRRIGRDNIPEALRVRPMLGDWMSAA
ncbi:MAG: aromatic ring-hydroxylating dioxygenase subunit alpha [Gammaproteobacteria bacterium]|nr:MAG: aromatic ring-hydroxylating dioxygenase subunit alpha [Gammaproteobacteria bacterium]